MKELVRIEILTIGSLIPQSNNNRSADNRKTKRNDYVMKNKQDERIEGSRCPLGANVSLINNHFEDYECRWGAHVLRLKSFGFSAILWINNIVSGHLSSCQRNWASSLASRSCRQAIFHKSCISIPTILYLERQQNHQNIGSNSRQSLYVRLLSMRNKKESRFSFYELIKVDRCNDGGNTERTGTLLFTSHMRFSHSIIICCFRII